MPEYVIEIGKTYRRKTVYGFRYATVTKIDLFNAEVYYDTIDVPYGNETCKEKYYNQQIGIEDFIEIYSND